MREVVHISLQRAATEAPRQSLHLSNRCVFFDAGKKAAFVLAYVIQKTRKQGIRRREGGCKRLATFKIIMKSVQIRSTGGRPAPGPAGA